MNQTSAVWMVLAVALAAANFPFLTERRFGVWQRPNRAKSLGLRVVELCLCYLIVGGLGMGLEHRLGQIYPQAWEFYAITAALFLTLAFPGFVWRYLVKH